MLIPVKLSEQWSAIEQHLPAGWSDVTLRVRPEQASELAAVARVLGPMGVGRVGGELSVTVHRAGGAAGPEAARRLFGLLDESRVWCSLEQRDVGASAPGAEQETDGDTVTSVAAAWEAATQTLPRDWSDLLCELRIGSSALLGRAALLCAPLNPARSPSDPLAFTFRAARVAGYGTSPTMVRRCLERLDEEGIEAEVAILRQLSETDRVATQGTVWLVAERHL
jgi:hypothetical protein